MSQKWCVQQHVEDNFMCNICQSLMNNPYHPKCCKHSFCKGCLAKVQDKACPMCRQPFNIQEIVPDDRIRNHIQNWNYQCDVCRDQIKVAEYETHSTYCSSDASSLSSIQSVVSAKPNRNKGGAGYGAVASAPRAGASAGASGMTRSRSGLSTASSLRGPVAANRYTFRCPYCHMDNMDSNDLINHCNQLHKDDEKNMICPICVSMPWGNPNQHSVDFITHLNLRHQFEYDKFVNYDLTDQEMLAEAVRVSLRVF